MKQHRDVSVTAVTAIAEADATGRTAEIFADIRQVMHIPLITSIWRTLEAVPDGLEAVWEATKPIYQSGWPERILSDLHHGVDFPVPEPIAADRLEEAGVVRSQRATLNSLVDIYNRSNGLNFIALTALVHPATGPTPTDIDRPPPISWKPLPGLTAPEDLSEIQWLLLRRISRFGTELPGQDIPTLWRHLSHWPEIVRLITEHFEPLQESGALLQAVTDVESFVTNNPITGFSHADSNVEIPDAAIAMIDAYVSQQPSVGRMVALGNCVSRWLSKTEI